MLVPIADSIQAEEEIALVRSHRVINHSAGVYVEGEVHTNTIEGFFGNLKTGMRGTYKKVSRKWLQSDLDAPKTYGASANRRRRRVSRLPGSLLRPVFPAGAFTTCWRSDLSQVRVELAFGRDWDLQALVGLLLAPPLRHSGTRPSEPVGALPKPRPLGDA